jgi:hypothetical protein
MNDIEIREAQFVFVNLECLWIEERNRNPWLMRALEEAENRLRTMFIDEWRERGGKPLMMGKAYAAYRKALLYHSKQN